MSESYKNKQKEYIENVEIIIRNATEHDIAQIHKIYEGARQYMIKTGNPNQWKKGYPSEDIIRNDLYQKQLFVVEQNGDIEGVFTFIIGEEPTYQVIEQGNWHHNDPYGTIHRVASAGRIKGFAEICFNYCSNQISYLRIDTHQDNQTMQRAIESYGFQKSGIIYVRNGERIAYDFKK